jgi:hypothetical protein
MQQQPNILNIIFIYNIEAMNISAGLLAWPSIYVMLLYPYPYHLAQLVVLVIWIAGAISIILNTYLPVLKLIFVVNFDYIFAQDPEVLVKKLLTLSFILGCIPKILICTYQFLNNQVASSTVAYWMGDNLGGRQIVNLIQLYSGFLFLINLILLCFAVVYIPFYVRKNHPVVTLAEIRKIEVTIQHIRLGRILLGSVVAIVCTIAAAIISKISAKARLGICSRKQLKMQRPGPNVCTNFG